MRTRPAHSTLPEPGLRNREKRSSSVVLPQPDGPTTATNSPRETANERFSNTAMAPNLNETFSTSNWLSLIAPPDARYLCKLDHDAIDHDTNHADNNHAANKEIHAKPVTCVPDRKAETGTSGNHLSGNNDEPCESCSDT